MRRFAAGRVGVRSGGLLERSARASGADGRIEESRARLGAGEAASGGSNVTLNELGSLGEFISGIAVVVTLVYLAIQIRHNTRAVRSSMHQDMVESTLRIAESVSDNADVGRIVLRADEDYDALTAVERIRFEAYAERVFSNFESVFYSYRNSMIEQDLWESWESSYLDDISRNSLRRFWHELHPLHLSDFMDFIDAFYRTHPARSQDERDAHSHSDDAAE